MRNFIAKIILNHMKKAVILLSGGLDSTTCLANAKKEGFTPFALSFRYGQRNKIEIDASRKIANFLGAKDHLISDIDLSLFGGSALTDEIEVPKDRGDSILSDEIPVTYVPARNTIFLSFALAYAEVLRANDIFIGVNALDYSGYPDCRPEYIASFQSMANIATKSGVEGNNQFIIHTPLMEMNKADIIKRGIKLGVDYGLTRSCYDPFENANPCGHCDACTLRIKGFKEANITDPLTYPK